MTYHINCNYFLDVPPLMNIDLQLLEYLQSTGSIDQYKSSTGVPVSTRLSVGCELPERMHQHTSMEAVGHGGD